MNKKKSCSNCKYLLRVGQGFVRCNCLQNITKSNGQTNRTMTVSESLSSNCPHHEMDPSRSFDNKTEDAIFYR